MHYKNLMWTGLKEEEDEEREQNKERKSRIKER